MLKLSAASACVSALSILASATCASAQESSGSLDNVKLFGRFLYDYTSAQTDISDIDVSDDAVRSARVGVSGELPASLSFKAEVETTFEGEWDFTDIYIQYAPDDQPFKVRAGQFKTSNSMDELTSGRFISTYERAAFTDAFSLNRRGGVEASGKFGRTGWSIGVFGDSVNDDNFDRSTAWAGRIYHGFKTSDDARIHLGGSVRYTSNDEGTSDLRYRQRPFHRQSGRIISTGRLGDSDLLVAGEAAVLKGSFWAAAEYAGLTSSCDNCPSDGSDLNGYYLEAGYFLGGERSFKSGKFGRPKVDRSVLDGGWGGLSFVLRLDQLDLNDGAVQGGELETWIAGIDWWPTDKSRVGVNIFIADADLGTATSGLGGDFATLVTQGQTDETVTGAVLRTQFDF